MGKKVFQIGEIPSKILITILFYTGFIPILYKSVLFGKTVYLTHTYQKTIKVGDWYTGEEVNNLPLGIFQGVILFLIAVVIWKVVCEIIFIVVRYFEKSINEGVLDEETDRNQRNNGSRKNHSL